MARVYVTNKDLLKFLKQIRNNFWFNPKKIFKNYRKFQRTLNQLNQLEMIIHFRLFEKKEGKWKKEYDTLEEQEDYIILEQKKK